MDMLKNIAEACIKEMKELETFKDWMKCGDKPCDYWRADKPKDRILTLATDVHELPFEPVFRFYSHPLAMKHISTEVEQAEVLHEDGEQSVVFLKMQGFGPTSPRESVTVLRVTREGDKAYIGNRSVDFPCKFADPKSVRAEIYGAGFILEKLDENKTKVSYAVDADFKGWIPWFIRGFIAQRRAQIIRGCEEKIRKAMQE